MCGSIDNQEWTVKSPSGGQRGCTAAPSSWKKITSDIFQLTRKKNY